MHKKKQTKKGPYHEAGKALDRINLSKTPKEFRE